MWKIMNDLIITFYLSAMIYRNYLQTKLLPDRSNCKGPVILNNHLPRYNFPSRKKVEPAILSITSRLCGGPHITGDPVSAVAVKPIF